MRIGFDLDGVLVDFHSAYVRTINKLFHKNYPIREARCWNTYDEYPNDFSPDMQKESFEHIRKTKHFWFDLKPYDYDDIKKIKDYIWEENIVYFITNRYPNPDDDSTLMQSLRWLEQYGVSSHGIVLTRHKSSVCRTLKLDYFLDDKPENVIDIRRNAPNTQCYLMDRKYNQRCGIQQRVKSIGEFLEKIKEGQR